MSDGTTRDRPLFRRRPFARLTGACQAHPDPRRHRCAGECPPSEPRSLLGYHEIARSDEQALCLVRVLEPDAEQVEVCWEDGAPATPLALHPRGGPVRGPHAVPPAARAVPAAHPLPRRPRAHQARPVFLRARSSPTSTCTCSARATTTASTTSSARTRRRSTASPARASPSGRRTPSASAWSALQPLGRPPPRHAGARRLGHLGAVHPRRRPRHRLQVRDPHPQRPDAAQGRSLRLRHAAQACQLLGGCRARGLRLAGRGLDAGARRGRSAADCHQHLRAAPRLVAARLPAHPAVPELARARRRADSLPARPGLHAHRADGRRRAPVRRFLGLPGGGLFRADRRGSARRRTSCTSSTAATRPASA